MLKDLGFLNTFYALDAARCCQWLLSVFLLKGFFDSLPQRAV